MSDARKALDDAVSGEDFTDGQGRAVLRGLRAIATHSDNTNMKLDRMSARLTAVAGSVGGGLVLAAILAALRVS